MLATASHDGAIRIWDVLSGKPSFEMREHEEEASSVAFSPSGRRLVSASWDGTARVWDVATGRSLLRLEVVPGGELPASLTRSACYSPDERRIATASNGVVIWDAGAGERLLSLHSLDGGHTSVCFAHKGSRLAVAGAGGATIWDAETAEPLQRLEGHTATICSIAWSPDDSLVATGSTDRTARIWRSDSGECLRVLRGHSAQINGVAFSGDGRRLLTGSLDRTARLWDVWTGESIAAVSGKALGQVTAVAFSPNGTHFATADCDGCLRIYRRLRPEWWWGIFCMLEFWFSAVFAVALVWSLLADRRTFARMDAEAARALSRRSQ
jgi:hypothetical protein